ncbi:SGNH/GDSL hydrolase family protein [Streptacidiphilus carbonis]|uniref:SGNH/GDSL hydrolase family protein n=1 Tax=Streptacidiphilus carbonis TaxID=105422 RepID=UPI000A002279|nr:SGNH/GDSL hydrolase family protein [Streptacidiphilus carbonis]
MSRERVARRVVTAAAYGGGGIGLLGAGVAGLLLAEAKIAAVKLDVLQGDPLPADGCYGRELASEGAAPLGLVVLGDSTAAGFGVDHADRTPAVLLAGGIAATAERPVRLTVAAANGAPSADLERQLGLVLEREPSPDIALIMVGANDVAQGVRPRDAAAALGDIVRRLRGIGTQVVVGTCPDLGAVGGILLPLRWVARLASHRLAAAQDRAVTEAGGHSVLLGALLGPEFASRPEMFASDRYHPSDQGYLAAAMTLLPTMCTALGVWPGEDAQREPDRPAAPVYVG